MIQITKLIRLTEDNIQEIWNCPAVYKITKLETTPDEGWGGNLGADEGPHTRVYIQGFDLPAGLKGNSYLAQDNKGYWRVVTEKQLQEINTEKL